MDELEKRIEAAQAAKKRVDEWQAVVDLAISLPGLIAERERRATVKAHQAKLAQIVAEARAVLSDVAEKTVEWRQQFLHLCNSEPKPHNFMMTVFVEHVKGLGEIQKPIFEARQRLQTIAGADFERLWAEAGGHDGRLEPIPRGIEELHYIYRSAFQRQTRNMAYSP